MAVLEATRLTECNSIPSFIESGSKMIFNMSTSPTSWTKDTTPNSIMLRVVNGTVSSGSVGSLTFPQVFTSSRSYSLSSTNPSSVPLTINPVTVTYSGMPDSGLSAAQTNTQTVNTPQQSPHLHPYVLPVGSTTRATNGAAAMIVPIASTTASFQPIGGGVAHSHAIDLQHTHPFPTISAHNHQVSGGSHTHPLSPGTISGFDLNYVDFIISSKN
jgi:hypothetical protein